MIPRPSAKVLFIPRWYPYPENPMFGLFIQYHAEAVQIYNQVVVLYVQPLPSGAVEGYFYSEENGIPVYRYNYQPLAIKFLNPLLHLWHSWKLWRKIKTDGHQIDLCHVHVLSRTALLPILLKWLKGIPFLIAEHWSRYLPGNEHMFSSPIRKGVTSFLVKKASHLTTVARSLMNGMQNHELINNNCSIVPNVVDVHRFVPGESAVTKTFLHVGCFDEKAKNLKGTLRAVRALQEQRNDFIFEIAGTGEDFQDVFNYAQTLGFQQGSVVFHGLVTGEELVRLYQKCTALVLFSHYETQGVVLLEALACNKVVVASDADGPKEIVEGDRGYLVPRGDEKALTDVLFTILDSDTKTSDSRRTWVVDHFSNKAVGKQFHEIYNTILKSKND